MCDNSSKFCKKILTELIDGNRSFLQILTEDLIYVNNSFKSFEYMGFVSAAAALLKGLGRHYANYKHHEGVDKTLTEFFQAILACRPDNPLAMKELATFFLEISSDSESFGFLKNACTRSGVNSYVFVERLKLIKFSNGK